MPIIISMVGIVLFSLSLSYGLDAADSTYFSAVKFNDVCAVDVHQMGASPDSFLTSYK